MLYLIILMQHRWPLTWRSLWEVNFSKVFFLKFWLQIWISLKKSRQWEVPFFYLYFEGIMFKIRFKGEKWEYVHFSRKNGNFTTLTSNLTNFHSKFLKKETTFFWKSFERKSNLQSELKKNNFENLTFSIVFMARVFKPVLDQNNELKR